MRKPLGRDRAVLEALQESPPWDWPEEAAETLIRTLGDPDAAEEDVLAAAECAGDFVVASDDMARALLSLTRRADRSTSVRVRAALSLGPVLEHADLEGFDDPEEVVIAQETFHQVQTTLHALHEDTALPKDLRRFVLEASVRAPQDWHPDAIRRAYASGDEEWRTTAVFAMRQVPGFDREILEAVEDGNAQVQAEAVKAAGHRELDAAWPHVARLLTAETLAKGLRIAAIEAAANLRPDEAGALLDELADSEDEDVAAAVEEARTFTEMPDDEDVFDEDEDDDDEREDGGESPV